MSMISSLIEELNKSADEWNGSNMFELAHMCRDAADTIWQLRDDLQRANAATQEAEHDESMAWDRVRKVEAENARLRKTLGEYECKMDTLVDSLTGGLLSKSMDTPNDSIEDAVREHVEGNLATENAKLHWIEAD